MGIKEDKESFYEMVEALNRVDIDEWADLVNALVKAAYIKGVEDAKNGKALEAVHCTECFWYDKDKGRCGVWKAETVPYGRCHNWVDKDLGDSRYRYSNGREQ